MWYEEYQHAVRAVPTRGTDTTKRWYKRHEDVALVDKNLRNFGCVLANMEGLKHCRTGKGLEYLVRTMI